VFSLAVWRGKLRTNGSTTRCPTGRPTAAFVVHCSVVEHGRQTGTHQTQQYKTTLSSSCVISCHGGGGNRLGFGDPLRRVRHRSRTPHVTRTPDVLSFVRRVGCDWFLPDHHDSRPVAAHIGTPVRLKEKSDFCRRRYGYVAKDAAETVQHLSVFLGLGLFGGHG